MNNNLKEYIKSFDNIIWLYRDIIDNKILENENLKNIDNETKKELFDYIFNKYLDSESELNSLSIDARYYGFFRLKDIAVFSFIEEYCIDKIKNEIEKIKISNVRDIFMRLDMSLFLDDKSLLNEIPFDKYLSFISDRIKDINYGNGYFYAKSMSLIFIINLLLEKIKEKEDIDKILDVIKKFDEFGQYNILEYIIYSLTKEEIQSDLIYDNLIKYCIKLFNEEKLRKSHLNKRKTKILEVIIDYIDEDIERLKYILDIYFPKDEKELNEIYEYIDYKEKYKLDIPLYCLSKNKVDIKNTLTDIQCDIIIKYLALYVRKDKDNEIKIIVKNILDEDIDLSIYWDLVREKFLEYCSKTFDLYFFNRYRNILQLLNPTKEEFKKFQKQTKNVFYWHIIKEDNKELYPLIPKGVKKAIETDKRYKEKIEEEKQLFQKERIECVHKFFDKNRIIEDIDNIIKVLGNNPTFQDLSYYNDEFYKGKYDNKEKYLEDTERVIINPFIIDYYLIISKFFVKTVFMDKIKEYVDNYWYKHWAIHLYNYLKRHGDIVDKVNFSEEEKNKIKDYFKSSNYKENIKDLHNCLKGTFDNSYLYFVFYNIKNIFDIEFEYDEEILINMLKIPYYYYRGDIKLYNNNYYLEYFGIIMEYDADNINFDIFFNSIEIKNSVLKNLIENTDKNKITDEFGSYYTLLSIIKLYNSDKENYTQYYNDIEEFTLHFYKLSLNKARYSSVSNIINNFIQENNLDLKILDFIDKNNQINYDHLKYINDLQRKLLETNKLYNSNDYYHNCYTLIYKIRKKINSKYIKIIINVNTHVADTIKNEIRKFEKYNNINYFEQDDFNNFKNDLKSIYDKFTKEDDFNSEESMFYDNLLYLQSFIIKDITIWESFTKFLIDNKDYYYKYDKEENLIFKNLFKQLNKYKNNFDFKSFINNLVLLYNNTLVKPYETGIVPNENLILWLLNNLISYLIELKLEEDLYQKIYKGIPFLDENVKEEIKRKVFNKFSPIKIEIKNNNYIVYNLKDNLFLNKTENIDELVRWLIPNDDNEVSRILRFDYLLNDIKNQNITISSPKNFEDPNENLYNSEDKIYIVCFSRTIDEDNAYAWWKIYGQVPNDKFENIKIRINFNKRNLIKNLLKDKNSDYIYYFGDIDYSMPKDNNKANTEIKDFFYKSYAFKFEDEFRVLIKCKNSNDKNIIYNNKNEPHLLKLPVNINLYRSIKVNKNSFNPYKHLKINTKTKIKDILIAYQKRYIRKNKKHIKNFCNKFITVIRRYVNVYKNKKEK